MSTTLDDLRDLPGFIYVATPYSKYHLGHTLAYIHAAKATAKLQQMGFVALSPIAHSHPVAVFGNIDAMDWEHWQLQNEPLMRAASALVVVQMPGWDESVGVLAEIEHFIAADKPVVFWEWGNNNDGAGRPADAELRDMSVAEGKPLRNTIVVPVPIVAWEPC